MTSSVSQWSEAFSIISIIIAIFAYIIPLPSYKHKITRHFWAWIIVRFVTFICMWYVLYTLGTILAFSLGIAHTGDDDILTVEMWSSIVMAGVALIFTFCGQLAWSFVMATVISTMISKFLPVDQVVHQALFPILVFVIIIALCYAMRTYIAKLIARIQTSLVVTTTIVFSSMYLNSGSSLWLSNDVSDNAIEFAAILIGTVVKLLWDWAYAAAMECCGYETLVSDPKALKKIKKKNRKGKEKTKKKEKKEKKKKAAMKESTKPANESSSSDDSSDSSDSSSSEA